VAEEALRQGSDAFRLAPEKLVYTIKWLGLTAGELVSEVKGPEEWRGRKVWRIEVTARTTGLCSTLYRIEDRYVSLLDAERLHSLRHEVQRREGGYKKDAVTDFDQEAHKAYFESATDGSKKVYDIPPDAQDTVTAAYVARGLPFGSEGVASFKVSNSEKVYELFLHISRHMLMHVPGRGQAEAVRLTPYARLAGVEVREGRASGYVTADSRRLPFLVILKAPVFTSVTATLK
jgi:hypothetical protein